MHQDNISLYCVLYDPYHCAIDPERVWSMIQSSGGGAQYAGGGAIDFYVPANLISLVQLMDSGLRIQINKSYI